MYIREVVGLGDVSQLFSSQVHLTPPAPSDEGRDGVQLVESQGLLGSVSETAEHGLVDGYPLDTGGVGLSFVGRAGVVHLAREGVHGVIDEVVGTLCLSGACG